MTPAQRPVIVRQGTHLVEGVPIWIALLKIQAAEAACSGQRYERGCSSGTTNRQPEQRTPRWAPGASQIWESFESATGPRSGEPAVLGSGSTASSRPSRPSTPAEVMVDSR